MPINIQPTDPGLAQDFQSAQGLVGANPLDIALKGVMEAPRAITNYREQMGLSGLMQTGNLPPNTPIGSPMNAFLLSRVKALQRPESPIDPDIAEGIRKSANDEIGDEVFAKAPTTAAEAMIMAQFAKAKKNGIAQDIPGQPSIYTDPQGNKWNQLPNGKGGYKYTPVTKGMGSAMQQSSPEALAALDRAQRANPNLWPAGIITRSNTALLANEALSAEKTGQTFDPRQANYTYKAGEGTAKGLATLKTNSETVNGNMDQLDDLYQKLSPSSINILNQAWQKGLTQVNDGDANKLLTLMNGTRALEAQVLAFPNAPFEAHQNQAASYFNTGLNSQGFQGVKQAIQSENNRRIGFATMNMSNPLAGQAFNAPGSGMGMVPMSDPQNKPKLVPMDKVGAAMKSGWTKR